MGVSPLIDLANAARSSGESQLVLSRGLSLSLLAIFVVSKDEDRIELVWVVYNSKRAIFCPRMWLLSSSSSSMFSILLRSKMNVLSICRVAAMPIQPAAWYILNHPLIPRIWRSINVIEAMVQNIVVVSLNSSINLWLSDGCHGRLDSHVTWTGECVIVAKGLKFS